MRSTAVADLEVTPLHMRKALGRFASGVTIVTTAECEDEASVHGMTANAFTSVSLDPPLVLVSIANRARMNQRIRETGRYGVSILAGGVASGRRSDSRGWYHGGMLGLVYSVIILIIAFLAYDQGFSMQTLYVTLLTFASGALGGIIGVNTKR